MTRKKEMLRQELIQKDLVIKQMLEDPNVRIGMDGIVWILRTKRPSSRGAEVDEDGFRNCIITTRSKRQLVYYLGYMLSVPRIIYTAFLGSIGPEHEVVHKDKDFTNNNPENLALSTESGGAGMALRKFDSDQIITIRERRARGDSLSSIACDFNTSSVVISKIVRGDTYKEVGGPISMSIRPVVPRGPDSYRANLSREQYSQILADRASGMSLRELSERYPLSKSGVSRLCKRERSRILEHQK